MLLLLLSACFVGGGERSWSLDPDASLVDVRLSNGSVSFEPGIEEEVFIEWSGGGIGNRKLWPEPLLVDDTILLDARCGDACGGDIVIRMPPGMALSGSVERGDLLVEQIARADVEACVAAGAVELQVPSGGWNLDLEVGAGSLVVQGVEHDPSATESISACVAAGDLTLLGL